MRDMLAHAFFVARFPPFAASRTASLPSSAVMRHAFACCFPLFAIDDFADAADITGAFAERAHAMPALPR